MARKTADPETPEETPEELSGEQSGEQTGEQTGEQETPQETPQGEQETPQETPQASNGDKSGESKPKRSKAPDTSDIKVDAIKAAVIADPTDPDLGDASEFFAAGAPQRARKPEQEAMDEVAAAAYQKWVKADRPSQWAKMPVVTFYLTDEELPKYRHLIRRACLFAKPEDPDTGVRVHFGNEFTLSEGMARKIGREEDAGKNVLMWAAVAKRQLSEDDARKKTVAENKKKKESGETPEKPEE